MAVQIRVTKEQIKGFKCPPGEYDFRFDGWRPKFSKDKQSVNLWPVLTIINHASLTGKELPLVCNTQSGWEHIELIHSLGAGETHINESAPDHKSIPGEFEPDPNAPQIAGPDGQPTDDPAKWRYVEDPNQPIIGQTGRCIVVEVPHYRRPGDTEAKIKKFFCRLPGCIHEHRESLVSSS